MVHGMGKPVACAKSPVTTWWRLAIVAAPLVRYTDGMKVRIEYCVA
jgi:hypothetical protein